MRRLALLLLIAACATAVARGAVPCDAWTLQPQCYVSLHPGPTEDTFGIVAVDGVRAYSPTGSLLLTTVAVESELDLVEWVRDGIRPGIDQVLREQVFPSGGDREDFRQQNVQLMVNSQLDATIAALRHLGYEFDTVFDGAEIMSLADPSALDPDEVEPGDVIVGVDGVAIGDAPALVDAISDRAPGDVVRLELLREGSTRTVEAELLGSEDGAGTPLLGVTVASYLELPVAVEVDAGSIGGPSAGLVFALSIVELLEAGDLLAGGVIAATGTIDQNGVVGPVGGVRQKVQAVVSAEDGRAAAAAFLIPRGNLDEALSAPVSGRLLVVPIDTLDDAVAALEDLRDGREPADAVALGAG